MFSVLLCLSLLTTFIILVVKFFQWQAQCWFCSFYMRVPWVNRNSFVCRQCGQYNGFTRDGDYNKVILSQFSTELNPFSRYQTPKTFKSNSDVLCSNCTDNQAIIVRKLSEYVPQNEHSAEEIKGYARVLESKYGLCKICCQKVNERLRKLDSKLLPSFIQWWHEKRRKTPVTDNVIILKARRKSLAWLELLIVLRITSIVCFLCIVSGPLLTEIGKQTCLVHLSTNKSYTHKFIEVFWPSVCRRYSRVYCSEILAYSQHLSLSNTGQIWFTSLMLCLQIALIIMDGLERRGKRQSSNLSIYRHGMESMILLCNVSLLLISANMLLSLLMNTHGFNFGDFTQSSDSYKHILLLVGFISVILILVIMYVAAIWLSFFLKDFKSQQKKLQETWPDNSGLKRLACLQSNDSMSYYSTPSQQSANLTTNSLNSSGKSLEDELAAARISPMMSTNTFRPSVLYNNNHNCPSLIGSQYSTLNSQYSVTPSNVYSTHYKLMDQQRPESCQPNEDALSCLSSVSQCKADSGYYTLDCNTNHHSPAYSLSRSSVIKRKSTTSKLKRRTGLIRFILFLLFGRLETWQDVRFELTCLANAVLLGVVIYCTCRLAFCLVNIFGV
ncbi:unnamed protein product [Heterobilharzia americana]|nr:unnamed protein product [Heterobilharzia americana]